MGNNKSRTSAHSAYTHKPRIVSFKKSAKAGYLEPVNARAHRYARKLGVRKYVKPSDLKPFLGYDNFKVYTSNGIRRKLTV